MRPARDSPSTQQIHADASRTNTAPGQHVGQPGVGAGGKPIPLGPPGTGAGFFPGVGADDVGCGADEVGLVFGFDELDDPEPDPEPDPDPDPLEDEPDADGCAVFDFVLGLGVATLGAGSPVGTATDDDDVCVCPAAGTSASPVIASPVAAAMRTATPASAATSGHFRPGLFPLRGQP